MPYYTKDGKTYFEDKSSLPGVALEMLGAPQGQTTDLPAGITTVALGSEYNGKVNAAHYPDPKNTTTGTWYGLIDRSDPRIRGTSFGSIQLPDQPASLGGSGSPNSVMGLSTSLPAVNADEIKRKTTEEFAPQRDVLKRTFDSRIEDAQGLNEGQKRSLGAAMGTGRRFSSSATAFIQHTDRENKKAIAQLELQRDEALSNFDFQMASLVNQKIAQEKENQQIEFENFFKLLDYAEKKKAEESKSKEGEVLSNQEAAVLAEVSKGTTDAGTIFQNIKNRFTNLRIETVSGVLDKINKRTEEQKEVDKLIVELGKNAAPAEIISKVSGAKNLVDAVTAAGEYLAGTSGITGEYNFYKRDQIARGLPYVGFDEYQTIDMNRKKSIAAAGVSAGSDLNTKEQAVFNRIVDKYNSSPAVQALGRANMLKNIVAEVEKNPGNATNQLALIYSYIKGLDTDSAVREGEIDLVKSIQSYVSKWGVQLQRVTDGKAVSADTAKQIATGAKALIRAIEDTAQKKEAVFKAQARANGDSVFNAWNGFTENVKEYQDTGSEVKQTMEQAKNAVIQYGNDNPAKQQIIRNMATKSDPELGRPLTYLEIMEALGIKQ